MFQVMVALVAFMVVAYLLHQQSQQKPGGSFQFVRGRRGFTRRFR